MACERLHRTGILYGVYYWLVKHDKLRPHLDSLLYGRMCPGDVGKWFILARGNGRRDVPRLCQ